MFEFIAAVHGMIELDSLTVDNVYN